ncbi:hypothetical protein [Commensalibacter oyaizuii]|uniref:Transcriptional regulator n=1 Tax=Commensalibacter oyaizuii TaxID=3043873 RepID=A0ABT6PYG2_9PROT|nr:hypothetical protein [Commensalibacter sp. TBRC 16381]MDI2089901.1 hypothetical protein [Commensalibacter sp. TBRC 16381]
MVQSKNIDMEIPEADDVISDSFNAIDPSEQRLEKALSCIEEFLIEHNNKENEQSSLQQKEIVLANLDMLIARVQDVLSKVSEADINNLGYDSFSTEQK